MDIPNYRKLIVWNKAHQNALLIIGLLGACSFKYARIADQCIGAATSIGANIAEGNSVRTKKERERYFEIALGSAYELDNWIQILKDSTFVCLDKNKLPELEKQNIEIIKILGRILSPVSI